MPEDRRRHPRILVNTEIRVTHPSFGSVVLMSSDLSDGGLFILSNDMAMPPAGEIVEVQGLAFGDAAPVLKAKIVRVAPTGIAVEFCDLPGSTPDQPPPSE